MKCRYGQTEVRGSVDSGAARPAGALGPGRQKSGLGGGSGPHPAQDARGLVCAPGGAGPWMWPSPPSFATSGVSLKMVRTGCSETGPKPSRTVARRALRSSPDRPRPWAGQAFAYSPAPEGHEHWTLRVLADRIGRVAVLPLMPLLTTLSVGHSVGFVRHSWPPLRGLRPSPITFQSARPGP